VFLARRAGRWAGGRGAVMTATLDDVAKKKQAELSAEQQAADTQRSTVRLICSRLAAVWAC
jgi:hypothetical protein